MIKNGKVIRHNGGKLWIYMCIGFASIIPKANDASFEELIDAKCTVQMPHLFLCKKGLGCKYTKCS